MPSGPRGRGVMNVEEVPPHFRVGNQPLTLSWSNGELSYIQYTYDGVTYRRTLTWSNGELTAISAWTAQ